MTRRFSEVMDRSLWEQLFSWVRGGLAEALPLKPQRAKSRTRRCPHCQKEIEGALSKCPHCGRLFRI